MANMHQYKQYYGMSLELYFDASIFAFDEVKERLLALFPERVKNDF